MKSKIENRKTKIENRKSNFFWSQPASQILKNRKVENREKPPIFIWYVFYACSTGIPIKLQTLSLLTKLQTRALKKYFDPSKIVENKQQPSKTWVKAFCEWKGTHYVIEKARLGWKKPDWWEDLITQTVSKKKTKIDTLPKNRKLKLDTWVKSKIYSWLKIENQHSIK